MLGLIPGSSMPGKILEDSEECHVIYLWPNVAGFPKYLSTEVNILAKFCGDRIKIVDFLLITNFLKCALFFHQALLAYLANLH